MRIAPRALGVVALVLGALAAVAGNPYHAGGRIDASALAGAIVREEDHVTAVELAEWIRNRKPALRVIDVRSRAEFDDYHVPTAENLTLEQAATAAFRPDDTIVLYSQGGAHAAQAWVLLRASGLPHVYFLSGGLDEWLDDVMAPVLRTDASPEERRAFARASAVSVYFGGQPRELGPGETRPPSAERDLRRSTRHRGC